MGTKTGMVRKEQTRCKRKRRIDDQDQKPKPRRRCLLCRSFSPSLSSPRHPSSDQVVSAHIVSSEYMHRRVLPHTGSHPHTQRARRFLLFVSFVPPARARINNQASQTHRSLWFVFCPPAPAPRVHRRRCWLYKGRDWTTRCEQVNVHSKGMRLYGWGCDAMRWMERGSRISFWDGRSSAEQEK